MNEEKILRLTKASLEGVILVSILIASLTIGGELYSPLKDFLKNTFMHHWLGKSYLSVALFLLILFVRFFSKSDLKKISRTVYLAVVFSLVSSLSMMGFFVAHTFHLI